MRLFRFVENSKFDFMAQRHFAFAVTAIMVFGAIGLFLVKGLNYGIDFSGGIMMEVRTPTTPNLENLRNRLNGLEMGNISIQEFGQKTDLMVRIPEQPGGNEAQQQAVEKVKTVLAEEYKDASVDYRRTEFVGPQVGDELKMNGILAFGLTILAIMSYIWWRFEWQYGVSAIVTVVHDTTAVVGFFSLLGLPFDLSSLAAVLMVAGYSTNDTVIVFDRIRENRRKYKKMSMYDLINMSTNQTLARTIVTSLTTLLALVALWLFGGEVVQDFVKSMIFGIVVGTYSSIYVASGMLLYMRFHDDAKRKDIENEEVEAEGSV